jgi:mannose/cellobiose epimerase-like protein (N-acyl-D-glucosamine 2-epimerase family)
MGLILSHTLRLGTACCSCLLFSSPAVPAASVTDSASRAHSAAEFRAKLSSQILPYWFNTAIDWTNGGYLLADDAAKPAPPATEKWLVGQSRMMWGFSHAHLHGLSTPGRNYLKAAEQGYRFLTNHFLDREFGGYFWATDLQGKPVIQRKILYGEAFVMYSLVEYYRASGDARVLDQANALYQVLQRRSHDARFGGWVEHFDRDWTPILKPSPEAMVEVGGLKSANAHLHLMEALTELYSVTHDPEVRRSLEEALKINKTWFYPKPAGRACFHRQLDWKPVDRPESAGLSYGHNVEFAWLMLRAEDALGHRRSWGHFDAYLKHALRYGYDHSRGGLYSRGADDQPATETDKIWWVQAELLAALTDGLKHKEQADYSAALALLLQFISQCQAGPKEGIWLDTVTADGTPKVTALAHHWKANYHDVRALVKFTDAFNK